MKKLLFTLPIIACSLLSGCANNEVDEARIKTGKYDIKLTSDIDSSEDSLHTLLTNFDNSFTLDIIKPEGVTVLGNNTPEFEFNEENITLSYAKEIRNEYKYSLVVNPLKELENESIIIKYKGTKKTWKFSAVDGKNQDAKIYTYLNTVQLGESEIPEKSGVQLFKSLDSLKEFVNNSENGFQAQIWKNKYHDDLPFSEEFFEKHDLVIAYIDSRINLGTNKESKFYQIGNTLFLDLSADEKLSRTSDILYQAVAISIEKDLDIKSLKTITKKVK